MAEIIELREGHRKLINKRIRKGGELVDNLKVNDADFVKKAAVTNTFIKSIGDEMKSMEAIELAYEKAETEKKNNKTRNIIQGVMIGLTFVGTVITELGRNSRLRYAKEREEEAPILTLTEKSVIQEGLREKEPKGFLGLFGK